MINAKDELLYKLEEVRLVSGAYIDGAIIQHKEKPFVLESDQDEFAQSKFFKSLDFDYDDGYGCQELFGIVWLSDGTWLERSEYDGAESWDWKRLPDFEEVRKELTML